jgi:hypothetical protein
MPSEFDRLEQELRLGQKMAALPPDRRRWLDHQLAQMTPPVAAPVHGMAKAAPPWDYDDGDAGFFEAPTKPPVRSAAEALKQARDLRKAASVIGAQVSAIRRSQARDRARDTAREALSKALALFHAGAITSHDVANIEARAHRLMAQAAAS